MDRDRMVDVGIGLVSRFGAKALSLTSVARQAGVARATAYRMFGGRDALVAAIVSHELNQLRTRLAEWSEGETDVAARTRVRIIGSLGYLRTHEALQYILRNEPEEIVRAIVSTDDQTRPTLIAMVVEACLEDMTDAEAAAMKPNPRAATEYLVRVVYSCMLVPESAMTDAEIADMVVRAVIH